MPLIKLIYKFICLNLIQNHDNHLISKLFYHFDYSFAYRYTEVALSAAIKKNAYPRLLT